MSRSSIRLALAGFMLAAAGGAQAADSGLVLSTSASESLVFNPVTVTTTDVIDYSTQILGRLNGGTLLYDQIFGVPFSDTAAQAGVAAARAAITTAGGPGVIIGAPILTASSSNTTSTSVTSYSLAGTQATTGPGIVTFGPANLLVGHLSTCDVASLPSSTRPTCQNLAGTPLVLTAADTNINVHTDTVYTIDQATQITNTTTQFEQWALFGTVQAFGMIHPAVQSGALDANARFLRRLGDVSPASGPSSQSGPTAGLPFWFEAYASGLKPSLWAARRAICARNWDSSGGIAGNLTPELSLSICIDHGATAITLDNGFESADLGLTQLGLSLDYTSGPWFATLAGILGAGSANTRNALIGQTTGNYAIATAGLLGEGGYTMQWGEIAVTPSLGFDYTMMRSGAFIEQGALQLTASAHTTGRTRVWTGVTIGQELGAFNWSVHGRVVGVVSGADRQLPVTYAATPMAVTGVAEPKIGGEIGGRISYTLAPGAEIFATYDGRFNGSVTAHAATAGLKVSF